MNEGGQPIPRPLSRLGLLFLTCYAGRADQGAQHPRQLAQMVRIFEGLTGDWEVQRNRIQKGTFKNLVKSMVGRLNTRHTVTTILAISYV